MSFFSKITLPSLSVYLYFLKKIMLDTTKDIAIPVIHAILNVVFVKVLLNQKMMVKAKMLYDLKKSVKLLAIVS